MIVQNSKQLIDVIKSEMKTSPDGFELGIILFWSVPYMRRHFFLSGAIARAVLAARVVQK